jgi:hypothetical protein
LRRVGRAFALKTGLDLCACKPNRLGASLNQDLKRKFRLKTYAHHRGIVIVVHHQPYKQYLERKNMNAALILHHYDFSSFSEKVRLVLGMKNLSWRSVEIPSTLPKPDYMPLTGGYRRAPALQIGADVFCDSVRIIAELEKRFPEPSIYAGHDKALQHASTTALECWTDSILTRTTVNYISSLHPSAKRFTPEFLADRAVFFGKSRPGLAADGRPRPNT